MRIAIRVDSSLQIGTGHVARTLALAIELRKQGARVEFLCRDLPGNVAGLAGAQGFTVHFLGSHSPLECVNLLQSAKPRFTGLVIDHYELNADWEQVIRPFVDRILVIDDLADRLHSCDFLLDPNFGVENELRYRYLVPADCKMLMGPGYALLRAEFETLRSQAELRRNVASPIQRLVVFYGGIDLTDETSKTLDALDQLAKADLQVDVVLGASNPRQAEVKKRIDGREGYRCLIQVANMAELMLAADLAIGAGGTASWERLCMGLPSLVISVAENQTQASINLSQAGFHFYLGKSAEVSVSALAQAIARRLDHADETSQFGQKGMKLVDGLGCQRAARELTK